jgi:hypothetical protein
MLLNSHLPHRLLYDFLKGFILPPFLRASPKHELSPPPILKQVLATSSFEPNSFLASSCSLSSSVSSGRWALPFVFLRSQEKLEATYACSRSIINTRIRCGFQVEERNAMNREALTPGATDGLLARAQH